MAKKARLDKATVVAAAAALAEAEGMEALTLHRLAAELGVRPPSLYNHVDGLPGLQRALAAETVRGLGEAVAQAALGRSGAAAVTAVGEAYRAFVKAHPALYLASLPASRRQQPVDAELLAAEERVLAVALAVMAGFGLTGDDALHAIRGLRAVAHGFATLEAAGGFGLPLDCDESFRRLLAGYVDGLADKSAATPTKSAFAD